MSIVKAFNDLRNSINEYRTQKALTKKVKLEAVQAIREANARTEQAIAEHNIRMAEFEESILSTKAAHEARMAELEEQRLAAKAKQAKQNEILSLLEKGEINALECASRLAAA